MDRDRLRLRDIIGQWRLAAVATALLISLGLVAEAVAGADQAAETPIQNFTFGGNTPWFLQNAVSHDSGDAHQSGAISHSQSTWMETTITGPGAVRFWWKVSSESCCDRLDLTIDGTYQAEIRGEVDWQSRAYAIPEGTHTLRWTYSTDGSVLTGANAGWVDQVTFTAGSGIDVTPPVTTASPSGGMYGTSQNVTLACSDTSGCASTLYCLGDNCTPTTPYGGAPIPIASPATLRYFSADTAGNAEIVKSAAYSFDTTPPKTSIYPDAGTYSGDREVSLYCHDTNSSCAGTSYCLGTGCIPSTPYNGPMVISSSTDLRFSSTDRVGNTEAIKTATYTITPDITPPVTLPTYSTGTYAPIWAHLFCDDSNGSGCASILYCLGSGCTPDKTYYSSIYVASSTDFRFFSRDRSGNSEAVKTVHYTIDGTPPTTTATPGGGIFMSPQRVTLACADDQTGGCAETYYCLEKDCYPSTPYSGPISVSTSTHLRFYSRDHVGNMEIKQAIRIVIRSEPPTSINVPADRSTIQEAIEAATDGDTVLVAPGTYLENINFRGKAITVRSSAGPDVTIIDGNQAGTVVTFNNDEDRSSVLDGFTIRNGTAGFTYPGYGDGGGVYVAYASPGILNNRIMANTASWGGGIAVDFGSPLIRGNTITRNTGSSEGGGICIGGTAAAQVIDNVIEGNSSSGSGGGISLWAAGEPIIRGNTIIGNSAYNSGGGISMVNQSDALIVQNLIVNNRAGTGGGVYWGTPSGSRGPYLINNTIAENDGIEGSGVYADGYDANALLVNNIIAAKTGQTALFCGNFNDLNPPRARNNIVHSPAGIPFGGLCAALAGTEGNSAADPLLNAPSLGLASLRAGSPAIDAGDESAPGLPETDMNGMPRLIAGNGSGTARVDVGAYEYDPTQVLAEVADAPTGAVSSVNASITVGGPDIVSYRYSLDGGPFTAMATAISNPIAMANLTEGPHSLAVIGKNSEGREQFISAATVARWTVDNLPPVTAATPPSGRYQTPLTVTLTCSDGGGCAETLYCLGNGCTPATPYGGPIAITSPSVLRFHSRDMLGHQEAVRAETYDLTGSISGRATDAGTSLGVPNLLVTVCRTTADTPACSSTSTDANGYYILLGIERGSYRVSFRGSPYLHLWYDGSSSEASATPLVINPGDARTGINAIMTRGGSIAGRVTDAATGGGMPYTRITVYKSTQVGPSFLEETIADYLGNYTVSGLTAGAYKIQFSQSMYATQWYSNATDATTAQEITVALNTTTAGINAALLKLGGITGIATDAATGARLSGITVIAYNASNGSGASSTTDANGAYSLIGLANGSYHVRFSGGNFGNLYQSQWYNGVTEESGATPVTVAAPAITADINAALVKSGSLSGRVTDAATGTGIAGVYVSAYAVGTQDWGTGTWTDANGEYILAGLADGNYQLHFNGNGTGYFSQWYNNRESRSCSDTVVVASSTPASGVDATLTMGGRISGRVTDAASGEGIPNASLIIQGNRTVLIFITDSSGEFTVSGLPSGDYTVEYRGSFCVSGRNCGHSYAPSTTTVTVTAPETTSGANLALTTGGSITGRLTDRSTGAGIEYIWVHALHRETGRWFGGLSNADGTYAVYGLPSGTYSVQFSGENVDYQSLWYPTATTQSGAAAAQVIAPDATTGIDGTLAKMGGSISGQITDRDSGMALGWVEVSLWDAVTGIPLLAMSSDWYGSYTFRGLPPGNYKVRFGNNQYLSSEYQPRWYGDAADFDDALTISVDVTGIIGINGSLTKGGNIAGKILNATCPTPGMVRISAYDAATGKFVGYGIANTDLGSDFTLNGLPTGSYKLEFTGDGGYIRQWYRDKSDLSGADPVTVTAPYVTNGIDVLMAPGGGSISGRVTDLDGNAVPGMRVKLFDWLTNSFAAETTTDTSGSYRLAGLPGGAYKVLIAGDERLAGKWYTPSGNVADAPGPVAVPSTGPVNGIDGALSISPNGDLDGSGGHPTIADVHKALRIAIGRETATNVALRNGDVAPVLDGVSVPDGRITLADVLLILRKAIGLAR